MKKEDVLSYGQFKIVEKKGARFDDGQLVVPVEYNYISRAKKNLFVATKGSVNAYRTHGIEAAFYENDRPYGIYFNEQLRNKSLDTEVHFYTINGQLRMKEKVIACLACLNDDMLVILKENYKWSIVLIDYEHMDISEIDAYSNLEYIKDDYSKRRFVICENDEYSIVSFDSDSEVLDVLSLHNQQVLEFTDMGMVIMENGQYGFMKYNGDIILNCFWDSIRLTENYIKVVSGNKTAVYLYNGYCVFSDTIKSFEWHSIKGCILFKVQDENGYFRLYSVNKQLLHKEVTSMEILSDGTMILGFKIGGYALAKYDIVSDKLVPILPADCFESITKLFDSMKFICTKVETKVEAVKDDRVATFDCDGNLLTKFKLFV